MCQVYNTPLMNVEDYVKTKRTKTKERIKRWTYSLRFVLPTVHFGQAPSTLPSFRPVIPTSDKNRQKRHEEEENQIYNGDHTRLTLLIIVVIVP